MRTPTVVVTQPLDLMKTISRQQLSENCKRGVLKAKLRRLKPEKTTGVLRNVLILFFPGSYSQGSADQESYLRNESKLLAASSERMHRVTTVVRNRSVKYNAIFAAFEILKRCCWSVLPRGHFTFQIYGNTMLRYEQQTLTTLFCTLKSDFLDVKSIEF